MIETGIWKLLDGAGNLATIGLLLIMWKFDRRILAIELNMKSLWKDKKSG